ncbi:hypothetical protein EJ06DRAFT_488639 [Trichodelitschia bisporula]|uniref:rRNA methyltransferase 1, mitochondrial n=1 Tax=Trichodelitschia bisporula TaxID=703511 RepID=A0A6G1I6M4_9PEZI|nr:hypothetical protein EJ06DRAFT_488639 [Trichodelitschia bisporula]
MFSLTSRANSLLRCSVYYSSHSTALQRSKSTFSSIKQGIRHSADAEDRIPSRDPGRGRRDSRSPIGRGRNDRSDFGRERGRVAGRRGFEERSERSDFGGRKSERSDFPSRRGRDQDAGFGRGLKERAAGREANFLKRKGYEGTSDATSRRSRESASFSSTKGSERLSNFRRQDASSDGDFVKPRDREDRPFKTRDDGEGHAYESRVGGKTRSFRPGDRDSDRNFKSRDRDSDRSLRSRDRDSNRNFKSRDRDSDRTFKSRDGDSDRTFKSRDGDSDRTFKSSDRDSGRTFKPRDRDSDTTFKSRDRDSDRLFKPHDRDSDTTPTHIPLTTAASQLLYGRSTVHAALKSRRRQLYTLYLSARKDDPEHRALYQLARSTNVPVKFGAEWLPLLDRASNGRPHNGVLLEASPLPFPPIETLGALTSDPPTYAVTLGTQTAEDAAVNGTPDRLPYRPGGWRFPVVLFVDDVLDEGNLGSIVRSAYYLGFDALAISTRTCAPLSPITLKASAGAAEALPLLSVSTASDFLHTSTKAGWRVYCATTPEGKAPKNTTPEHPAPQLLTFAQARTGKILPADHSPASEAPVILVIGGEGVGLRGSILRRAWGVVQITPGVKVGVVGVDSLNVAVAGAVVGAAVLMPGRKGTICSVEVDRLERREKAKAEKKEGEGKDGGDKEGLVVEELDAEIVAEAEAESAADVAETESAADATVAERADIATKEPEVDNEADTSRADVQDRTEGMTEAKPEEEPEKEPEKGRLW